MVRLLNGFWTIFSVLVFAQFQAINVEAFFPVSTDRFIEDSVSSKVDTLNAAYASHLLASDFSVSEKLSRASTATSSNVSSTAEDSSTVEVYVKPGMSILSTDDNSEAYYVNVTIGDDAYPLIIDTGSAYLWVYGDSCDSDACSGRSLFSTENVQRADGNMTFSLAYTTGSASGYAYEDRIIVNKLATTQNFTFGVANQVPSIFDNYLVSGIFGLPSSDSDSIQSIISVLSESNAIAEEKFSMIIGKLNATDNRTSISSGDSLLTENKGIFVIGEMDQDLYSGEVQYTSLLSNENHYWQVGISSVSIDGIQVNFTSYENVTGSHSHTNRTGIIDSGTTLLILPKPDALDIHTFFPNSVTDGTNFAIYCNSTEEIVLTIGEGEWKISSDSYLGEAYGTDTDMVGYCVSNIQGLDLDDSWILGDVSLKDKYVVFDVGNQRLGYAEKNENAVLVPYNSSTSTGTSTILTGINNATSTISSSSTSTSTKYSSVKAGAGSIIHPSSFMSVAMLSILAIL